MLTLPKPTMCSLLSSHPVICHHDKTASTMAWVAPLSCAPAKDTPYIVEALNVHYHGRSHHMGGVLTPWHPAEKCFGVDPVNRFFFQPSLTCADDPKQCFVVSKDSKCMKVLPQQLLTSPLSVTLDWASGAVRVDMDGTVETKPFTDMNTVFAAYGLKSGPGDRTRELIDMGMKTRQGDLLSFDTKSLQHALAFYVVMK